MILGSRAKSMMLSKSRMGARLTAAKPMVAGPEATIWILTLYGFAQGHVA